MFSKYPDIMTTEEVAELLRLNTRTILKLVNEKKLPSIKIANQFRFIKQKIADWLDSEMNSYPDKLLSEMEKDMDDQPVSLIELLPEHHIIPDLESSEKKGALQELVDKAGELELIRKKSEFMSLLIERERMHSTGMGMEIALPHARTVDMNLVNKTFVLLGRSRQGINYDAIDNVPVKIILLLAVPMLPLHLKLLSHVARIFKDDELRKDIIEADSAGLMLELIRTKEKALLPA